MTTDKKGDCPACTYTEKPPIFAKYCEEHDVCIGCGIHRSKLEETPYGVIRGAFQCKPCSERERLAGIKERKKRGFDHEDTNEIVCPYCGYEQCDSWEAGEGDNDCPECHKVFEVERIMSVTYNTSKKVKKS